MAAAMIGSGLHCIGAPSPLSRWTWENPRPQGNPLYALTWGADRFVAAGYGGTILTSSNGYDWERAVVDSRDTFSALGYGNNMFVAGSATGGVVVSIDGKIWNQAGSGLPGYVTGIAFSGDEFVAVTSNGWLGRSTNAVTWSAERLSTEDTFWDVACGEGTVVIAAGRPDNSGNRWTLPRGETNWIVTFNAYPLFGATWGGGRFIVVGSGTLVVSTNGTNWEGVTGVDFTDTLYGAACGPAGFVACGYNTSVSATTLFKSTGGYTWERTLFDSTYYTPRRVAFGGGVYVAVGEYGEILVSADGASWTSQLVGVRSHLRSMARGNGSYVAVGDATGILKSLDGEQWMTRTALLASTTVSGITFGKGRFVATTRDGAAGKVLCSTNGDDWQVVDPGTNDGLWAVTYANGKFVAAGARFRVLTSNDAKSWTNNYTGSNGFLTILNSVAYGSGTFVVAGGGQPSGPPVIVYSTNATNWTAIQPGSVGYFSSVVYGKGMFVAAGTLSTLMYSTNGINWLVGTSPVPRARGLAFGEGQFVLAGDNYGSPGADTSVYSSTNGIDWILRSQRLSYPYINALLFDGGRLFAVGDRGTILQSAYAGLPRLVVARRADQEVELCITAQEGSSYRLQSIDNLATGYWQDESAVTNANERTCLTRDMRQVAHRLFRISSE
jgi:hypothetical protein